MIQAINEVQSYAADVTDWIVVKKEILRVLPVEERQHFSTRDPKTKKHTLNDFERLIIDYWKQTTGQSLVLKE